MGLGVRIGLGDRATPNPSLRVGTALPLCLVGRATPIPSGVCDLPPHARATLFLGERDQVARQQGEPPGVRGRVRVTVRVRVRVRFYG